jgi:hypothetical protein
MPGLPSIAPIGVGCPSLPDGRLLVATLEITFNDVMLE